MADFLETRLFFEHWQRCIKGSAGITRHALQMGVIERCRVRCHTQIRTFYITRDNNQTDIVYTFGNSGMKLFRDFNEIINRRNNFM